LLASQNFRLAKRCLEILDELFGRDWRFAGQVLEPGGHVGSTARNASITPLMNVAES
jgi:hypothetical protein